MHGVKTFARMHCLLVCLSAPHLRPSESLPTHRNNDEGSLRVTLFHTTLTNFSDQNVPGSQLKTAGRWRDLQRLRAQSFLHIRSRARLKRDSTRAET